MGTLAFTRWTRIAGLFIAIAIVASAHFVGAATKRIVLIAGKPSHPPGEHEFRAGSMLLQKALSGISGVKVVDGNLHITHADGAAILSLGEATAVKWARKIESPPRAVKAHSQTTQSNSRTCARKAASELSSQLT